MSTREERLAWGRAGEIKVAEFLRRTLPHWRVVLMDPPPDWRLDKGDIHAFVPRHRGEERRVYEVKRLGMHDREPVQFTCFNDWPFKDRELPEVRKYIVNGRDSFMVKIQNECRPTGVFTLNSAMTHYAYLPVLESWEMDFWPEEKADPNRGPRARKIYLVANAEECQFGRLA
jgi:hypothetical protein